MIQKADVHAALRDEKNARANVFMHLFSDGPDRMDWYDLVRMQHARDPYYAMAVEMLYEREILQNNQGVSIYADGVPVNLIEEPRRDHTPTYFKNFEDARECADAKFGGMCCDIRFEEIIRIARP